MLDDVKFPALIVYTDNNQISLINSFKDVEAERTFVVLKVHCITVQWKWFFIGFMAASIYFLLYILWR